MALYTNNTRLPAIVTIRIENAGKPSESIMIGSEALLEKTKADVGYHDFLVDGGKELHLGESTTATIINIRSVT